MSGTKTDIELIRDNIVEYAKHDPTARMALEMRQHYGFSSEEMITRLCLLLLQEKQDLLKKMNEQAQQAELLPKFKNKKTGDIYVFIGYADDTTYDREGDRQIIYRPEGDPNKRYVRLAAEFAEKFEGVEVPLHVQATTPK